MENIVVANKEICEIEKLLLPNGHAFAPDAREVIRCWDSKDVSACPGSGKTTVLLAKLKILSDRMPLDNGSGVCVLSHTNVAVNEIKTKLATCAVKLMGYPNYVGTIQTFIDRFVVNPYLKTITSVPLQVVDDEVYTQHFLRIIATNGCYRKLDFFLKKQCEASHFDNIFEFCKKTRIKNGALYLEKQAQAIAGNASDSAKQYSEVIEIGLSAAVKALTSL